MNLDGRTGVLLQEKRDCCFMAGSFRRKKGASACGRAPFGKRWMGRLWDYGIGLAVGDVTGDQGGAIKNLWEISLLVIMWYPVSMNMVRILI